MRYGRIIFVAFLLAVSLGLPHTSFAQQSSIADQLACFSDGSCEIDDIFLLLNAIIGWGAGISGALALLLYIIGGVWMLFSGGNSSRVERGKDIIIGTSVALIFVLGSWIIIDFTTSALTGRTGLLESGECSKPESNNKGCSLGAGGASGICYSGNCLPSCQYQAVSKNLPYECLTEDSCDSSNGQTIVPNICDDNTLVCCVGITSP